MRARADCPFNNKKVKSGADRGKKGSDLFQKENQR
jgi:hypothetical protein